MKSMKSVWFVCTHTGNIAVTEERYQHFVWSYLVDPVEASNKP